MNKYRLVSVLLLLGIFISCDKYNLERVNQRDSRSNDYSPELPSITTANASDITFNSAKNGGSVNSDGNAPVIAKGVCWSIAANPTIDLTTRTTDGTGPGLFSSSITGLTFSTTYHIRAYATNSVGTAYGSDITFTTADGLAFVTTGSLSATSLNSAVSGGEIITEGAGPVTARGVCWSTSANPAATLSSKTTDGSGTGLFTSTLTNLTANTRYYARAYATNVAGTSYGKLITFMTQVADADGNVYGSVFIGTQIWMTANLKTTKYNDGTNIPAFIDNASCNYSWYNNNNSNKAVYGALYNWYVTDRTSNGNKNVCPVGWHVPSDAEWTILSDYLGGEGEAGGKLKETGTIHWINPNTGATNETGFTGVPGGMRDYDGTFSDLGGGSYCWSATTAVLPTTTTAGIYYHMRTQYTSLARFNIEKQLGMSIRCLKD